MALSRLTVEAMIKARCPMADIDVDFQQWFELFRTCSRLTAREIATMLGMSKNSIDRYVMDSGNRNHRKPSEQVKKQLRRLARKSLVMLLAEANAAIYANAS